MKQDLLVQGVKLYRNGKYTDALKFFQSLSPGEISDLDTAYFIGLCYMKLKRYEDALLYLEQVVTIVPENDIAQERVLQCRLTLAIIYTNTGRMRLAEFELKSLKETGYKPAAVYSAMAYIAWMQKDYDPCVELYEKVLEVEPDNITALNGLGYVLACRNKDLTRALMLSKKALDLSPESVACLDSVGWVYYKLGLVEEAASFLKKAIALSPENQEIQNHLQTVLNQRNIADLGGQR